MALLWSMLVCFILILPEVRISQEHNHDRHTDQLTEAVGHLYRRYLRFAEPHQLRLQDAHDVQWRDGMMRNDPLFSTVGSNQNTILVNPEQRGILRVGSWSKHTNSDVLVAYHYGSPVLFHLLSDDGTHEELLLGNPIESEGAKFTVFIPKNTYSIAESTSNDHFSFISIASIPAYDKEGHHSKTAEEMAESFPDYAEMIRRIDDHTKPSKFEYSSHHSNMHHDHHMMDSHHHGSHEAHHGDHDNHHSGHDHHHEHMPDQTNNIA